MHLSWSRTKGQVFPRICKRRARQRLKVKTTGEHSEQVSDSVERGQEYVPRSEQRSDHAGVVVESRPRHLFSSESFQASQFPTSVSPTNFISSHLPLMVPLMARFSTQLMADAGKRVSHATMQVLQSTERVAHSVCTFIISFLALNSRE